jgi:hypothetical protein
MATAYEQLYARLRHHEPVRLPVSRTDQPGAQVPLRLAVGRR